MAANVSLRNVVKIFGTESIVNGINLEIKAGEFVVLVGPSGCGKSTTLRMVAGLEQISDGTIAINGQVVNHLAPKDRGVAMVFQNYALYPHLTVRDNMSFGLRLGSMKRADIDERVLRAADILELGPVLDRQPAELSGGQRQRVAMGRAIVRDPDVFLFDEPLSNLDAKLRTQMRVEIKRLHARLGNTIIYVTHDQLEAMTLADRIIVMRKGVIEQVGTPDELFDSPVSAFVAAFIGSPPMNLISCKVGRTGGATIVRFAHGGSLSLPNGNSSHLNDVGELLFGVRPEDIYLQAGPNTEELVGAVELVEPLGGESLVHVRVGTELVVVRAHGRQRIVADGPITLYVNTQRMYLFDRATDQCVYPLARHAP